MNIAVVRNLTQEVVHWYPLGLIPEGQAKFAGEFGDPSRTTHLPIPDELDPSAIKVEDGIIVVDEVKLAAVLADNREPKLMRIREIRDAKLKRVDQLVNIAFLASWTAGEKTELREYRQALLDITEPFKDDMSLLDVVVVEEIEWPEEPSEE